MDLTEQNRSMNDTDCWKVFKYDVVNSTNETAKNICADYPEQFVVTTDAQSNGKGQFGRKWLSPSGENVLATFCIPRREIGAENLISFAVANAVCVILKDFNLVPKCKWPNDIEVNDSKIAGILTEKTKGWVLIGIGLNLNWPVKKSELENGKKYTSLFAECGNKYDADKFVLLLSNALNSHIKQSSGEILKLYKSFWNKKRNIEILVDSKWLPAKQIGIDTDGTLIAGLTSGKTIKIKTSARIRGR